MTKFLKQLASLFFSRKPERLTTHREEQQIKTDPQTTIEQNTVSGFLKTIGGTLQIQCSSDNNHSHKSNNSSSLGGDSGQHDENNEILEIVSLVVERFCEGVETFPAVEVAFSPKKMMHRVCELHSTEVDGRQIRMQVDFSPSFPSRVVANPAAMTQVFILLMDNAVRFNAAGSVTVTCFVQKQLLVVNSFDTGEEISRSEQELILNQDRKGIAKAFADVRRKGLVLTSGLVKAMGGSLLLKSEPRMGNIVTVQIPVKEIDWQDGRFLDHSANSRLEAQETALKLDEVIVNSLICLKEETAALVSALEAEQMDAFQRIIHGMKGFPAGFGLKEIYAKIKTLEQTAGNAPVKTADLVIGLSELTALIDSSLLSSSSAGGLPQPSLKDLRSKASRTKALRILVAEDNEMNQEMIAYILRGLDFSFQMVKNGREVLERLQRGQFDLLLLDMQMPVMDGVETIKQLRMDPRWERLPVIAVTAQNLEGDDQRYKNAGCDDFVAKPIDINDLTRKITRLIG